MTSVRDFSPVFLTRSSAALTASLNEKVQRFQLVPILFKLLGALDDTQPALSTLRPYLESRNEISWRISEYA